MPNIESWNIFFLLINGYINMVQWVNNWRNRCFVYKDTAIIIFFYYMNFIFHFERHLVWGALIFSTITKPLDESFQLHMGFSFPFLRANDLRSSSLIMRTHIFYSIVSSGYILKVSVQLVPKYFSRDCSSDSISCSERKKHDEKNIKTRQKLKTETRHCSC